MPKLIRQILTVFPYLLMIAAGIFLYREFSQVRWPSVAREIAGIPGPAFAAGLGLLLLNYVAFFFYDVIALRQMRKPLPYPVVARTAPLAFSITNVLGHSMITGLGFRYREYSKHGITLPQVTGIVVQNVEVWWVGFGALCAVVFIKNPAGMAVAAALAAYLFGCYKFSGRAFKVGKFHPRLPDFKGGVMKIAVASADILLTAATLFVLLPESVEIGFSQFMPLYLLAHLSGVLSLVPGGLGVIEAVLLQFLRPYGGDAAILAGLLMYRVVHYFLPAAIGLIKEAIMLLFKVKPRAEAAPVLEEESYGI